MWQVNRRELRAVLAGIPKGVQAVTRSCDDIAKARAMQVIDRLWSSELKFWYGGKWRFASFEGRSLFSH